MDNSKRSFSEALTPLEAVIQIAKLDCSNEWARYCKLAQQLAQPVALTSSPTRTETSGTVVETVTHRPQMHGEVTLTYGVGSGGSNFYGGSVVSTYVDPDKGYSFTIGLSQYRGNGFLARPWRRDGFYPGDGFGPYGYGYGNGYGYGYPGW